MIPPGRSSTPLGCSPRWPPATSATWWCEDAERLAKQLQHALDTRVVIEQAKGVIAERAGIEPGAAFEVIRSYARPRQRRVLEVAREIVSGELEPS